MTDNDPAVEAAAKALREVGRYGQPVYAGEEARAAVAAARPIIEAEVRERIARDIEAAGGPKRDNRSFYDEPARHQDTRWAAYRDAARIARGEV